MSICKENKKIPCQQMVRVVFVLGLEFVSDIILRPLVVMLPMFRVNVYSVRLLYHGNSAAFKRVLRLPLQG